MALRDFKARVLILVTESCDVTASNEVKNCDNTVLRFVMVLEIRNTVRKSRSCASNLRNRGGSTKTLTRTKAINKNANHDDW